MANDLYLNKFEPVSSHALFTVKSFLIWLLSLSIGVNSQILTDLEDLSLLSRGATCLVGTYSLHFDSDCSSAIDGTTTSYTAPPGNGWMTITMESVAVVSAVDILLDGRSSQGYDESIRLRVIFSDKEENVVHVTRPRGNDYDSYRQRVLYPEGVLTKSVTISWTANKMAAIVEISVLGSTTGITRILPTAISCARENSDCSSVHDGDKTTSLQLVGNNSIQATFQPEAEVNLVVLYAHPLLEDNQFVPLSVSLYDQERDKRAHIESQYRNQGWKSEATWQTLPISFRFLATYLTLQVSRDYTSISELELYNVRPDISRRSPSWLGDLGFLDLASFGQPNIRDLNERVIGDMPPRPTASSSDTTTGSTNYVITTHTMMTSQKPHTTSTTKKRTTQKLSDLVDLTHGDHLVSTTDEPITTPFSSQAPDRPLTITRERPDPSTVASWPTFTTTASTPAFSLLGLNWIWYLLMGIGAFTIVLIVLIVVLIVRLRSRKFTPKPAARPRVVLRSVGSVNDSDAISVVTPTRGYYHLTFGSQSSVPLPYTACSPNNTSTFGHHRNPYMTEYKNNMYDKNGMPMHDGELSDDCFL